MGDFNTGSINNIANIKLGNVQVNNVFMGTTGIWTNKLKFDYTIVQELTFLDPYAEAKDSGQIQGMNNTIVKSISQSSDNFTQLTTIPYSTTKSLTYYNPFTTLTQSNSFSDTIYKSDLNKFKLTNNQFHNWYAGSSVPVGSGVGVGSESWHNLDDTNAHSIVTNGAYNGSVVLKNQPLDIPIDLKINGYKQIDALQINYDEPVLTNGALTIRMWIRTDNLSSNHNYGTINSFRFYALNCNLSAYDDAGVFFDFNNNFDITFDDGTATYTNGNGVCEMIWVWNFTPSTMGFMDAFAECGINSVVGTILSISYNNTTITVDEGYLSNGVYLSNIFFDNNGLTGMNWITLGGDNIMPINTRLKNYKVTLNYNLTDVYPT
jgi:hypothetical protein